MFPMMNGHLLRHILRCCRRRRGSGAMELREVFNGLRYVVKTGAPWRWMPNDLRVLLRLKVRRKAEPSAVIIDSRTLRSTPQSGARAGYDGAKRKKGSKVHIAGDRSNPRRGHASGQGGAGDHRAFCRGRLRCR